jgi:hypothetical protein
MRRRANERSIAAASGFRSTGAIFSFSSFQLREHALSSRAKKFRLLLREKWKSD